MLGIMDEFDPTVEPPSKSELKRRMNDLQKLGESLVELPRDKLDRLSLPDNLRQAIEETRRISSNGGLRRQLQYIGRLMRSFDAEPVAEQMRQWQSRHNADNAFFHQLERWRDQLIADDANLGGFLQEYPSADSQQLRTLARNARKELAAGQAPKSSRALFRLIRETAENSLSHDSGSNML